MIVSEEFKLKIHKAGNSLAKLNQVLPEAKIVGTSCTKKSNNVTG
jgi:hypothetical protein